MSEHERPTVAPEPVTSIGRAAGSPNSAASHTLRPRVTLLRRSLWAFLELRSRTQSFWAAYCCYSARCQSFPKRADGAEQRVARPHKRRSHRFSRKAGGSPWLLDIASHPRRSPLKHSRLSCLACAGPADSSERSDRAMTCDSLSFQPGGRSVDLARLFSRRSLYIDHGL